MMRIIGLLFCYVLAFAKCSEDNEYPEVQIGDGIFKGSIIKSRLGKDIYSFRGIRYAEAPIGQNRFKQSLLVEPHVGIFDATEDGPKCIQVTDLNNITSEDCLRLNIYTNELPQNSSPLNKDVVVFIHPGSYESLSGRSSDFGPEYLLDKDIILVTINYRLGALGFMSTGNSYAPGNAGLKDQVIALKWIHKNIEHFGGNINSVTLLGYGTGAQCVSLHMVSPMTRGYFHRAIIMSDAAVDKNPLPYNYNDLVKSQAEFFECPIDSDDSMFDCFYSKSVDEFAQFQSYFEDNAPYQNLHSMFGPVIEHEDPDSNPSPFLTAQPIDIIRQRNANFVPVITGLTEDEHGDIIMLVEEYAQIGNHQIYDMLNDHWEQYAPIFLRYESNSSRSYDISRELKSFYLHDEPANSENYRNLAQLVADDIVGYKIYNFVKLMAEYSSAPVYNYLYNYQGCDSVSKWFDGTIFGVSHYDDLYMIFKNENYISICETDMRTLERLTGMIAHFAKTGEPIENNADYSNVDWKPSTTYQPSYVNIREEWNIEYGFIHAERMQLFERLFPLPLSEE